MDLFDGLRGLTKSQRAAVTASLLGWSLDAFDFFLLTFVLGDVAKTFQVKISQVSVAIMLTLAMRPLGALVFGYLADRFGRRPVLQIDLLLFSAIAFSSAFAPNLTIFLILRAAFGFAMGGEWGTGAALTLESIPTKSRGVISGLLQEGWAIGALLGALANLFLPHVGWRGLLMFSAAPALLILYIRRNVDESPSWVSGASERKREGVVKPILANFKLVIYLVILMTAFNFLSHGTQDLFPTFLKSQHHFSAGEVTLVSVIASLGAILGGIGFGALSEKWGRRRAILTASLCVLPVLPLVLYGQVPIALAAAGFLMQLAVQGAWGVAPVHLNELAPAAVRGLLPGLAYQLGNLLASQTAPLQAKFAETHGDNYGLAIAGLATFAALGLAGLAWFGPEAKGKAFETSAS